MCLGREGGCYDCASMKAAWFFKGRKKCCDLEKSSMIARNLEEQTLEWEIVGRSVNVFESCPM